MSRQSSMTSESIIEGMDMLRIEPKLGPAKVSRSISTLEGWMEKLIQGKQIPEEYAKRFSENVRRLPQEGSKSQPMDHP